MHVLPPTLASVHSQRKHELKHNFELVNIRREYIHNGQYICRMHKNDVIFETDWKFKHHFFRFNINYSDWVLDMYNINK